MEFVINSLLNLVESFCTGVIGLFTGDIWGNFIVPVPQDPGGNWLFMGSTAGWFDKYLPGVSYMKEAFLAAGYLFATLFFVLGLLRALLPDSPSSKAAHPGWVVARYAFAMTLMPFSYALLKFIQTPMSELCLGIYNMRNDKENGMASTIGAFSGKIEIEMDNVDSEGHTANLDGDTSFAMGAISVVLLVIMTIIFFKLVMEMVERFVVAGFLFYASPLAISMAASEGTSGITKSFFQMIISQYLLLIFDFMILYVFLFALGYSGSTEGKNMTGQELFFYYAMLIAWLRLGTRLDEMLSSLGLSVARTGAGLGAEIMGGVGATIALGRATVGTIRKGTNLGKKVAGKATGIPMGAKGSGARAGAAGWDKDANGNKVTTGTQSAVNAMATTSGERAKKAAAEELGIPMEKIKEAEAGRGKIKTMDERGNEMTWHKQDTKEGKQAMQGDHVTAGSFVASVDNQNRNSSIIGSIRDDVGIRSGLRGESVNTSSAPGFEGTPISGGIKKKNSDGSIDEYYPYEGNQKGISAMSKAGVNVAPVHMSKMNGQGSTKYAKVRVCGPTSAGGEQSKNSPPPKANQSGRGAPGKPLPRAKI